MCEHINLEGTCPAAPDEALIESTMLKTIREKVGDKVSITYTAFAGNNKEATTFQQTWTIVGTYTIDDETDPYWFDPAHTFGDGLLRPPPAGSPPLPAPSLLVAPSGIQFSAIGGAERAIDMQQVDIDTMDAAQANLVQWQSEIAGEPPPVIQSDDVVSPAGPVRGRPGRAAPPLPDHPGRDRAAGRAGPAAALRADLVGGRGTPPGGRAGQAAGFLGGKVVRFAVAEPVAVLLFAVPVGIALAVVASRAVTNVWLGQTPFVVTPQAVASAVIVTAWRWPARWWPCWASSGSRSPPPWPRPRGGVRRRAGPCSPRAPW